MKRALITGINGQDGSYLSELLLSKGYGVHGIIRRTSFSNLGRINHICEGPRDSGGGFFLHYGDLSDSEQITSLIYDIKPDEIYNLGAQSHVRVSFDLAEYTGNITALGAARVLEAIRRSGQRIKFYQASSSEMFGNAPSPQDENTPFYPCSPYAASKVYAYWMTRNYRQAYKIFACNGILFNHESPRRGDAFVSRKITRAVANILIGRQKKLFMGNLEAKRDWGFTPEYVEMMHSMLQQDAPDDFVIGTGQAHSVREFLEGAFGYAGLDWRDYVEKDDRYVRLNEVNMSCADASKAKKLLDWSPRVVFKDLVKIMVDAEMRLAGSKPIGSGDNILKEKFPDKWWRVD